MNEKGAILYLGGFELPDKNAAAHRVLNNAKIFREIGYRVVFLDIDKQLKSSLERREDCFGFSRWSVCDSSKKVYSAKHLIQVAEGISDLKCIIAYNHPAISLERLRQYSKKRGIKLVADVTEWYAAEGKNIVHKVIKGMDTKMRMCYVQPRIDGVIAISRYIDDYYTNKVPTLLLPPLTDIHEEKWNMDIAPQDPHKISIVYAGGPGRNKDKLNLILRALVLCDVAMVNFRVIGLSQKQYLDKYPGDETLLQQLGGSVTFLGRVPHTEAIKAVKSADFSLFYRELTRVTIAGFPTKFAEAFTCGTPVITNKSSNLIDYLVDGVNGYWIDNINEDLQRVLSNDVEQLKSLKKNMDNAIFHYGNYIEKTREWMDSLLQ